MSMNVIIHIVRYIVKGYMHEVVGNYFVSPDLISSDISFVCPVALIVLVSNVSLSNSVATLNKAVFYSFSILFYSIRCYSNLFCSILSNMKF